MLSFVSVANMTNLFSDESTPVHLLWHIVNTLFLKLLLPVTLLQSLYYTVNGLELDFLYCLENHCLAL